MPSRTSKQGFHCGGSRSSGVPPTGTSVGARRSRSTSLAEAKMGGGNAQKSAKARADKQAKMAKANKGARARGDDSTILTHAVAPPQFSHLSDPRRTAPATAAPRRLPARVQRQGDEHPVQGLHGHVPVHHDRGEAQGALRQQAPEARFLPVLPSPEAVNARRAAAEGRAGDVKRTSTPPRRRRGDDRDRAMARELARGSRVVRCQKDQTSHARRFTRVCSLATGTRTAPRALVPRRSDVDVTGDLRTSRSRGYTPASGLRCCPPPCFSPWPPSPSPLADFRVSRRGCDGRRCRCRTC